MMDRHCEDSCWYCCDKCFNCLNPAGAEYYISKEREGGNPLKLKFCSEECQSLCLQTSNSGNPTSAVIVSSDGKVFSIGSPHLQAILPTLKPKCFPISESHTKVLHVFMQAENAKGYVIQKELILCIGDGTEGIPLGSKYVVHWSSTLHSQNFLEYHIDEEFLPTLPVYYLANEPVVIKLIEAIKQCGDEQVILKRASEIVQSIGQSDKENSQDKPDQLNTVTENIP